MTTIDRPAPTLTQVQIIQSLASMLSIFEQEMSWGVSPGEHNHLTGRIGELYAAMITRGQMALATNQRGYDVVSARNERISVKTVTTSSHVTFNRATFDQVDRIIVLRINVDEERGVSVEELLDVLTADAGEVLRDRGGNLTYSVAQGSPREPRPLGEMSITARATYGDIDIVRYESGQVRILKDDAEMPVNVKGTLRPIAAEVGVDTVWPGGVAKNTQVLGLDVIRALNALHAD